jgi:diacylglycerol kinase
MLATFLKHQLMRFAHVFRGILYALRHDRSFQIQFFLGGVFVWVFSELMFPLTEIELAFLILSWVLVLITELQNTAFEAALDKLHPEMHEKIGRSKDMASGAVFIAALFALGVVTWILIGRL